MDQALLPEGVGIHDWGRGAQRQMVIHSSDYYFLGMMLVCSCVVLIHWGSYKGCREPLHVWLLVDYMSLFSFRSLQFVAQYLSCFDTDSARMWEWCTLGVINLGLYPFLWCWTIVGSVWLFLGFPRSGLP